MSVAAGLPLVVYLCMEQDSWRNLGFLGEVEHVLWVLKTSQVSRRKGQVVAG